MTYAEAYDKITTFESTGVLYEWKLLRDGESHYEGDLTALPPSKMGFKADVLSLLCMFRYEIKEQTTHLPRKKKKKLEMHYNKKVKKLNQAIRRRYDI